MPLVVRIALTPASRKALSCRLQQAYAAHADRLTRRIHAIFLVVDDKGVAEVAEMLGVGEQTVRDWVHAFVLNGFASLFYKHPVGRPPRLTESQRKELANLVAAGPEAAGYPSACWTAVMLADLIRLRFKVDYNPRYVPRLLKAVGFSYQKARFESDHLTDHADIIWLEETWPEILRLAKVRDAVIFFGDEVGFAQWGSLSYTWSPIGVQPTVKTSGKRKSYKVFGLLDCFNGRLLYKGLDGKLNSETYAEFLTEVLAKVDKHIILIQSLP